MDGAPGSVDAVATLRAAVDQLLALAYEAVPPRELPGVLAELEVQRRRLEAVDVRVVAGLAAGVTAAEFGATSLPDLVAGLTRVTRGEARARVTRAVDLGPRRAVTGQPLEPIHPVVASALSRGELAGGHVDVITRVLGRIPAVVAHEPVDDDGQRTVFDVAEEFLVEAARHEDPAMLRRTGELLLARLDPDGLEPREEQDERERGFGIGGRRGPGAVHGRFTTETAAVWQTILDALAAPRAAEDGEPDTRTAEQRRHDAMLEAGLRLLRSGTLGDTAGVPVSVVVHIDADDLERARRGEPGAIARTAHGELISAERLLRLAGEAEFTSVVLTATGGVLDYGRTRRLASPGQRRALAARDRGCCFPGCDRPSAWTEVHHICPWLDGGETNLDNLCLLCAHHHRSFEAAGWTVTLTDGVPQWTPPAWLDPYRRPRRNTAHHPPELAFAT